jgi:hypothetical protein
MTQSESLRIKWAVTLFLLEVGYNRKTAKFQTITCLKKGFSIILIRVNKKIHASQHVSKMTFEQMLTIHLQKKVNRFRSILTGSSQPGPTGSLAIWFSSSQILTAAQGRSPWCCIPLTG